MGRGAARGWEEWKRTGPGNLNLENPRVQGCQGIVPPFVGPISSLSPTVKGSTEGQGGSLPRLSPRTPARHMPVGGLQRTLRGLVSVPQGLRWHHGPKTGPGPGPEGQVRAIPTLQPWRAQPSTELTYVKHHLCSHPVFRPRSTAPPRTQKIFDRFVPHRGVCLLLFPEI